MSQVPFFLLLLAIASCSLASANRGGYGLPGQQMLPNVEYNGEVYFAEYQYYHFRVTREDPNIAELSVENLGYGCDVAVYVNYEQNATINDYQFTGRGYQNEQQFTVQMENLVVGVYSVAVYGYEVGPTFPAAPYDISLISGSVPSGAVPLEDGYPVEGTLVYNSSNYYYFNVTNALVNWELQSISANGGGHAHTWVGLNYYPTQERFDLASQDYDEDACIYLENPVDGQYFVLVQEYEGTEPQETYKLTVNFNSQHSQCGFYANSYATNSYANSYESYGGQSYYSPSYQESYYSPSYQESYYNSPSYQSYYNSYNSYNGGYSYYTPSSQSYYNPPQGADDYAAYVAGKKKPHQVAGKKPHQAVGKKAHTVQLQKATGKMTPHKDDRIAARRANHN